MFLAITFGACAAIGVGRLRQFSGRSDDDLKPVVIARSEVPGGQKLTDANLKLGRYRPEDVPKGAFSSIEEASGRTTLVSLVAGTPIVNERVTEKDAGSGLAVMVPEGMRAFTILTPQLSSEVGGFIKPGYRVDVLLTTRAGENEPSEGIVTTTILQNIKVLAVAQKVEEEKKSSDENKKPETDETKTITDVRSVTLLVTPSEAEKLALGMNRGMLHLSLRNLSDEREAKTSPATTHDLKIQTAQPLAVFDLVRKLAIPAVTISAPQPAPVVQPAPVAPTPPEKVAAAPKEEPKPAPPQAVYIRTLRGFDASKVEIEVEHQAGTQEGTQAVVRP
jgi:pilus assembly protein CpaB